MEVVGGVGGVRGGSAREHGNFDRVGYVAAGRQQHREADKVGDELEQGQEGNSDEAHAEEEA